MAEEYTCIECENLYDDGDGDTDEKLCNKCGCQIYEENVELVENEKNQCPKCKSDHPVHTTKDLSNGNWHEIKDNSTTIIPDPFKNEKYVRLSDINKEIAKEWRKK